MKANVKVTYSQGHRPAQITYGSGGLSAEFTLMTKGTGNAALNSSKSATPARGLSVRPTPQATSNLGTATTLRTMQRNLDVDRPTQTNAAEAAPDKAADMPSRPKISTTTSIDTSAPPASINPESLFFPAAEDDDNQWDPQNYEEDQGIVTWETSNVFDPSNATGRRLRDLDSGSGSFKSVIEARDPSTLEIPPTQRLSQIRGLFD